MTRRLAPALFAVLLSCGADFGPDRTVRLASLQFEGAVLSLNETRILTPLFLNGAHEVVENVDGVTWKSSDSTLATVDNTGHVRGVALGGPVTFTVSAHGHSATATVSVVPDRIIISDTIASLILGESRQLSGMAVDFNGAPISSSSAVVRWHSGDVTIATVDATGLVKAIAPGDVFIYAEAAGRTNGLHLETGNPSAYDGRWAGVSVCGNCQYPTTYPIDMEIFFGRIKSFRMTVSGPPPYYQCGVGGAPILLSPPTGSPNAVVRDDRFSFTVVPEVVTISGMFTSQTTLNGSHTSMTIPVVCVQNLLPVPPLTVAAGTFTAIRQ